MLDVVYVDDPRRYVYETIQRERQRDNWNILFALPKHTMQYWGRVFPPNSVKFYHEGDPRIIGTRTSFALVVDDPLWIDNDRYLDTFVRRMVASRVMAGGTCELVRKVVK